MKKKAVLFFCAIAMNFLALASLNNLNINENILQKTRVVMLQMVFKSGVRSVYGNYPNEKVPLSY